MICIALIKCLWKDTQDSYCRGCSWGKDLGNCRTGARGRFFTAYPLVLLNFEHLNELPIKQINS